MSLVLPAQAPAAEFDTAKFKANPWAYAKERAPQVKAERDARRAAQSAACAAWIESEWVANNPIAAADQTRARLAKAEAALAEQTKALADLKAATETAAKESAAREAELGKKLDALTAKADELAKSLDAKDKAQSAALAEARKALDDALDKMRESAGRRYRQLDAMRARTMRDLESREFSGIEMIRIPAGEFIMGSTPEEVESLKAIHAWTALDAAETPAHPVAITRPFLIGRVEVTHEQWKRIMGEKAPFAAFKGEKLPMESISWDEARAFCAQLGKEAGGAWRLPTEAEWEYACRAGGRGLYGAPATPEKLDDFAWSSHNAESKPHEAGGKAPNAWGICDMHGNVWEWCADGYDAAFYAAAPTNSPIENPLAPATGTERVFRGGAYGLEPPQIRAALRGANLPDFRSSMVGFRVVREIE